MRKQSSIYEATVDGKEEKECGSRDLGKWMMR